jgi:hypothetical protein
MFYDHFYYIELNECTMKSKRHGIIMNYGKWCFSRQKWHQYAFFKKEDSKAILYEYDD